MKILTESLIEGSKRAKGLVVIIDVFRAFTTAAFVMGNNAEKIILVSSLDEAFAMKKKHPDYILMGERKGLKVEGFDLGNSPYLVKDTDFTGESFIQTTSSGTQGVVNAKDAEEILLGNFVCAGAIIKHIKKRNPDTLTLVAMGSSGVAICDEDELCAKYIKESLEGKKPDFSRIKEHLRNYSSAHRFFDKSRPEFPEGDFHCAMELNRFNFVLKVIKENGLHIVRKEEP